MKRILILSLGLLIWQAGGALAALIEIPGDYDYIQDGINAAAPGDTVAVDAGVWREQLRIDKSLTLQGDGIGSTIIEAIDLVDRTTYTITSWTGSSRDIDPCIGVTDAADVFIADLTVDGRQLGPDDFYGIHFMNSSGSVTDCGIEGLLNAGGPSASHVVCLVATHGETGGPFAVEFSRNIIPEFQKCGILIMGPQMAVVIDDNEITNAPSDYIAGNGMQISYGATGSLSGNIVNGVGYTGEDWSATGILLFECEDVSVNGGEVYNCQTGINFSDWTWIYTSPGMPQIVIAGVHGHDNDWNLDTHLADAEVDLDIEVRNCNFHNNGVGVSFYASDADPWGGSYYGGWSDGLLEALVENNLIVDCEYGIIGDNYCTGTGNVLDMAAHGNDLGGSIEYGVYNGFTDFDFDATDNWWGDATGPNLVTLLAAPQSQRPRIEPATFADEAPSLPPQRIAPPVASERGSGVNVSPAVVFFPWRGTAALAPLPVSSGPINCSQVSTLNFHYTPDPWTPALRGYEITVACSPSELLFDETDIVDSGILGTFGSPHAFYVVDNGDGTFTVSGAILGGSTGLETEADFFSIDFHGQSTGTGLVEMVHYKLRDLDNGDIFASLDTADIEVDCTPPDIPTLDPEPTYTQGTSNTLYWSDMNGSGADEYLLRRAQDAAFTVDVAESGWIAALSHEFTSLLDGQIYYYEVRSRDALLNESPWSASVFSTQDDSPPISSADALPAYHNTLTFDVAYTATDATSGVASVELFYDFDNSGSWTSWGSFPGSPISFTATLEGEYDFMTVATDVVGNVEAPTGTPDATTIVDVSPPVGNFSINNGNAYTNSPNVTLSSNITDDNPPLQMRFSEDTVNWTTWVSYLASSPFLLSVSGDGVYPVYAEYRDAALNVLQLMDDIIYDTSPPGAPSDIAAANDHEQANVSWNDPGDADLDYLEIWRGVAHDGAYSSAYPEYDDLPAYTIPTRPASRAAAQASSEWTLASAVAVGVEYYEDVFLPRGLYFYEVFAVDYALNHGPPAVANDWALNYWLGDVSDGAYGSYDGYVDAADITQLGVSFGVVDGHANYLNEVDVGPTDDMSVLGMPTTDNIIDLEDLMMFAINYGQVSPLPDYEGSEIAYLSWFQTSETSWALALREPCADLKGLRVRVQLPAGSVSAFEAGALMEAQASPYFLANVDANGLDLNLALLGRDAMIQGNGVLLRLTMSSEHDLPLPEMTLRSTGNGNVDFELSQTPVEEMPTVYHMAQNFPNPFNPTTTIRFGLPETQDVHLRIFAADGRLLRTLLDGALPAGYHACVWDGRNDVGERLSSGIYFYRIEAGPLRQTSKMLMLK